MVSNLTLKIGADIAGLQKDLQKATGHLGAFNKQMDVVGKSIAGVFAVDQLMRFGKQVFDVTAEFQKFEAVLTNTLGSKSAAKAALNQITEFAVKTPFQVNELTASFVKLSNQGFVPTLKEMTSLGDLAAAMGKSFDQLTEAIIDAQTGEFERLKEFGVRAQKQGDQVTFTFKGVKTQVDFTADSIRQYILSLGQAQGVTGGMEAQSKTLGGGLSNLKDQWDQLALAIGTSAESGGALSKGLDIISQAVSAVRGMFDPVHRLKEELKFFEKLRSEAGANNNIEEWAHWNTRMVETQTKLNELTADAKKGELELQHVRDASAAASKKAAEEAERLAKAAESAARASLQRTIAGAGGLTNGVTGKDDAFGEIMNSVADKHSASSFVLQAERLSNTLKAMGAGLRINSQEWAEWEAGVKVRMQKVAEKIEIDFAPMIHSALSGIGQALGSAINGSANLGKSLLKVLGGVLIQLGEMLLSVGIGIAGFKKALTSLNPAIAIGAGVALIALGTAVAGSMKSLGSSSGSSHSSAASTGARGGSSRGGMDSGGIQIEVGGEFRIQGPDLVYIFNRQQQLNGRTRG